MNRKTLFIRERDSTLNAMLKFLVLGGALAYIPSVWLSIQEGLWLVAFVDTLAYVMVIVSAFAPWVSFRVKLALIVSLATLIGAVVLIQIGPYGAGYVWLLAALVLSALFGRTLGALCVLGSIVATLLLWAFAPALGIKAVQTNPLTVFVIGTNLVVIGVGLVIVIRSLLGKLELTVSERENLSQDLARELEMTRTQSQALSNAVSAKEVLLKELHHRVKNNLQVVMSIISMAHEGDDDPCETTKRRVRVLSLVNELALARDDVPAVDAGELFRTLAARQHESRFPKPPKVLVDVRSSCDLDPQSASLAALLASDLLAVLCPLSSSLILLVRSDAACHACVEIRLPPGVPSGEAMVASVLDRSLAKGSLPEVEAKPLPAETGLGAGARIFIMP
ncbi:MAG TPA: histidine kinase dimerization/phosphoacceptor domain -containing protein [Spirochaetales bacterium]|nr:histidine kinase dimerization/phosphoacceptor domain -containing protein [Spirochaetales bacterium]